MLRNENSKQLKQIIGPDIHIGTDEYDVAKQDGPGKKRLTESFRAYTNELIRYVKSKGKTPHFWGSLKTFAGEIPVSNDAVMDIWNTDFGDAKHAIDLGYEIVNMEHRPLYIVPIVSEPSDCMNIRHVYENWETECFFPDTVLPYGHPQLKGAVSSLWSDISASKGFSMDDSHYRLFPVIPLLAEKTWASHVLDRAYVQFAEDINVTGEPPLVNLAWRVESIAKDGCILKYDIRNNVKDQSGNGYDAEAHYTELVECDSDCFLTFNGASTYLQTPLKNLGFGWTLIVSIQPDEDFCDSGILLESDHGRLTIDMSLDGGIILSEEKYSSKFKYILPKGRWTKLMLTGDHEGTALVVNDGEYTERL
ncbi:family 20 glycosylhydrolase [Paenibacillus sp. J5C_2022]|uniref:family 20 glycosylhydrolase n=1 Tax=Paenibacillus sp. J5C2022 TaxID=2977129 RepID=UPI0021CE8EE1|nr:family 20 glycosylhydrolase [Paenibacillus sp. J5C2022]MCU6710919.1 family 20 glycosylhydrolase [Paenibacillus sp. J5C2022]